MRLPVLALALFLSACATKVQLPAVTRQVFDPVAFFMGRTSGDGTYDQVLASPRTLHVESFGRADGGGGVVLTQVIRQEGKAQRTRTWVMRPVGPNRYSGTLTEALGPVEIVTEGPRATIRYAMKDGLSVHQQLALQADGRTLLNHLEVRKWGIRVARVDETIRKLP